MFSKQVVIFVTVAAVVLHCAYAQRYGYLSADKYLQEKYPRFLESVKDYFIEFKN